MDESVAEWADATIERLTREGFGVACGILAADATGDGEAADGDVASASASADPTLAYLATLSEDERRAYADALAEHTCTAQTGPEAARIAAEVEDAYVHEHQAELLAIAAVLAEQD